MLNKSVYQARIPPARASVLVGPSARVTLRYLAYTFGEALLPTHACALVGPSGLEPPTSCLSGTRSNHLSYEPSFRGAPDGILSGSFSLVASFLTTIFAQLKILARHAPGGIYRY